MAVTRYRDPASLFGLQRLNRILDEAFGGLPFDQGSVITSTWFAPTDILEDENGLQIHMELPGVDPNDVRLSLENNVLTIRGEKQQQQEQTSERVHRSERTFGVFERTFVLPNTIDPDRIEARYETGVLVVRIPKAERARPREIRVNASGSGSTPVGTGSSQATVGSRSQGGAGQTTERQGGQGNGGTSSQRATGREAKTGA